MVGSQRSVKKKKGGQEKEQKKGEQRLAIYENKKMERSSNESRQKTRKRR